VKVPRRLLMLSQIMTKFPDLMAISLTCLGEAVKP
jgi:hypothetical protein